MGLSNSDIAVTNTIRCRQGNTFNRALIFKTAGVVDDITSDTFKVPVLDSSGQQVMVFTMGDGCSIVAGKLKLTKTADQMLAAKAGNHTYAIEQTFSDNTTVTRMKGPFTIIGRTA